MSVVSDSVRPHGLQPTRLLCPRDSPSKNTGVGCHFLLQGMKVESESEVAQSRPTLSDPIDCSLPGSSIHGIFQATALEWGAIGCDKKTSFVFSELLLGHFTERKSCSHPGSGHLDKNLTLGLSPKVPLCFAQMPSK